MIYIHKNIPGVLRKVNEIIGDHNVDKQMTDSRGDVSSLDQRAINEKQAANRTQVAYLMADISNVDTATIKDLYERLENLPCKTASSHLSSKPHEKILTLPDQPEL